MSEHLSRAVVLCEWPTATEKQIAQCIAAGRDRQLAKGGCLEGWIAYEAALRFEREAAPALFENVMHAVVNGAA